MVPVKRVEIITCSVEIDSILKAIHVSGATGYTEVRDVAGSGERGLRDGADLSDAFRNTMIVTACTAEQATVLIDKIRPILKRRGGMCLVSDAQWIIH
ncbi:MAG: transcriptional regulator [Planctomycetota bacterium]